MSKKVLTVLLGLMLAICCCLGVGCVVPPSESESESIEQSNTESEIIESETSESESEIESESESESEPESESESIAPEMVEITFTAGEGYTYSIEDCEVEIGSTVEFSVTLGADYDESVIVVKANEEVLTADEGVYSFVANEDTTVKVEGVAKNKVAITLVGGEGFAYSIENGEVEIGSTVEFSVTLGADYDESVIVVKANGEVLTAVEGSYSFVANANTEITVEGVEKDRVAITLTAGEGYTYSIENGEVEIGSTVEFSVTLGADYDESVIVVKANGEVLTAVEGTYSFVANANTEITVEGVEKDRVAITLTAGEGYAYSIEDCEVVIGTSVEFEVILDAKYNESDIVVKANGAVITADAGVYTVVASEDTEITVEGVERNQVVVSEIFAGYFGEEGSIVNTAGKYEHSTLVVGNDNVYKSTLPLAYVTLAKYTLIRFAIYAESGTWFEIGTSGNLDFSGNTASWNEIKLVRETDKYQLYFNGEWKNFNLPLDANLNEMCMKLARSGNFYLSEIRGIVDETYVEPDGYAHGEIFVADTFVGFNGTESNYINTLGGYKKSTAVSGSNTTYGGSALIDLELDRYLEIRFSVCADVNKYIEFGLVKNGNFEAVAFAKAYWTWNEFRLVRDGEVVKVYRNGNLVSALELGAEANLNEIQVKFATSGTFYLSEVVGIADPNYVEKVDVTFTEGEGYEYSIENTRVEIGTTVEFEVVLDESYDESVIVVKANGEVLTADGGTYSFVANEDTEITVEGVKKNEALVADVIVGFNGTESDFINTAGGYTKSTAIPGTNTTYKGQTLVDVELARYTEIRFSVYADKDKWVEIGFVANGNFKGLTATGASWTEIKFVNEGNGYFQAYVNGKWVDFKPSFDGNLSDLQIRLSSSGTFYFSEVRGVLDPNYVEKVDVTFTEGEGYEYSIENTRVEIGSTVEFSVTLDANYNESVIVVKANGEVLTADGGTYSFVANEDTEITVEGVKKNEVMVANLVVASSGTASDFINTAGGYKKSTVIKGKYNVVNLVNIDLAQYTEIRFSVYCEGAKYIEIALNNTMPKPRLSTNSESWTEIVLRNEGNGVYQAYRNGVWYDFSIPVGTNFGECAIRLGNEGVFYFSEVYGIVDPNYVAPEYANGYSRIADLVVGTTGTASDFINTDGGYKYSTVINGKYQVLNLADIDLSQYTEIRFSVYCEGAKYIEIALNDTMPKPRLSTNSESWTEIVLKNEGNGVFQAYRNGVWYDFSIPVGTTFSDCAIRLGNGGVFYFSEVIAK